MASVLTTIGACFLIVSILSCSASTTVMHQIQGTIQLLIAAVFFVGGAIVDRLPKRPKIGKEERE